jgi:hypothetical protein
MLVPVLGCLSVLTPGTSQACTEARGGLRPCCCRADCQKVLARHGRTNAGAGGLEPAAVFNNL